MNDKYFRYLLKEKNISIVEMAKCLNVTPGGLNYKIRNSAFSINDIDIILKKLDMEFLEVFRKNTLSTGENKGE
jgi:transcriptional regulator with XRE-family HTH domain